MTTTLNDQAATAALQMVRAEVNVRDFQRWMGTRRLQDPDHARHCLLTECFGDLAPKPFRLMVTRGASTGCLYGYGHADAVALREAAAVCADPLQSRHPACWRHGQQADARRVPGRQAPRFRGPHPPHSSSRKGHLTNSYRRAPLLQGRRTAPRQGVRRLPVRGHQAHGKGGHDPHSGAGVCRMAVGAVRTEGRGSPRIGLGQAGVLFNAPAPTASCAPATPRGPTR